MAVPHFLAQLAVENYPQGNIQTLGNATRPLEASSSSSTRLDFFLVPSSSYSKVQPGI